MKIVNSPILSNILYACLTTSHELQVILNPNFNQLIKLLLKEQSTLQKLIGNLMDLLDKCAAHVHNWRVCYLT